MAEDVSGARSAAQRRNDAFRNLVASGTVVTDVMSRPPAPGSPVADCRVHDEAHERGVPVPVGTRDRGLDAGLPPVTGEVGGAVGADGVREHGHDRSAAGGDFGRAGAFA